MSFWLPCRLAAMPTSFTFTATSAACVGPPDRQFFMGGVAMAAAVAAAEEATGKPLLWATMQFVSGGMLGDRVDIDVDPRGGRNIVQVGVTSRVEGRLVQDMVAALGARDGFPETRFIEMPEVAAPAACSPKPDDKFAQDGNMLAQFERRTAFEDNSTGAEYMWVRPVARSQVTAPLLALTSDFFLGAHPLSRGGTSLDNTVRLHALRQTEWILCATQLSAIGNGAIHGTMLQFAEDGTLLATSSQTGLLPRLPVNTSR
ncbi:acyl-CoA thioesterase [Pyruvatibacter mobilis]|uniref:acyl-CoA thioesterase n=1 Tax=Pyruvatibacter mobilis TaxID=1712261 RepID=UPI003BAC18D8